MEPPVVVAAHELQRPAVQPADDDRPLLADRAVDLGDRHVFGARAHREARAAQVLRLDGEQPSGDRRDIRSALRSQELALESLSEHLRSLTYSYMGI